MAWTKVAENVLAEQAWAKIKPIFETKLTKLALSLDIRENEAQIEETSDEEYGLTLFLEHLGVSVMAYLTEEKVRDGEGDGLGILVNATGAESEILFTYAPENYTPNVFTTDLDELVSRAEGFDAEEAASYLEVEK